MELRNLLQQDAPLVSPGCFDPLSALLIEKAGFACASISGAAVTAAAMGLPDHSFLGAEDLTQLVSRITMITEIPILVDCESGFGSVTMAMRSAQLMQKAGAACACYQDKLPDGTLMQTERMTGLLRGVLKARENGKMMIMARTDALNTEGMEKTLERCCRYVDCGVELLFINGIKSEKQMEQLRSAELGVPLKFNNTVKSGDAQFSAQELYERGFRLIAYSASLQKAAIKAMQTVLEELRNTGKTEGCLPIAITQKERAELLGDELWSQWAETYK